MAGARMARGARRPARPGWGHPGCRIVGWRARTRPRRPAREGDGQGRTPSERACHWGSGVVAGV